MTFESLSTPYRKIAIVGFTEHKKLAPYDDPETLIVGLNDLYLDMPPIPDNRLAWFQVHPFETVAGHPKPSATDFRSGPPHPRDPNHVAWLKDASTRLPVFVLEARPELPDALVLDQEAMFAYFGRHYKDAHGKPLDMLKYFTNSISWMLGWAIMMLCPDPDGKPVEGAQIGLWGVDMMMGGGPGSEYGYQRPSCEAFIAWAMAKGIDFCLPEESDLMKTAFQYGDREANTFRTKLRSHRNEMSRRRGQITNAISEHQLGHAELSGAINIMDWLEQSWMPGDGGDEFGRAPIPGAQENKPLPYTEPEKTE